MDMKFEQYHKDNPHLYDILLEYSKKAKVAGVDHYSIRAIMQVVRWHRNVETRDLDGFTINNNYSQDYAIKIMHENPELSGFFTLRF